MFNCLLILHSTASFKDFYPFQITRVGESSKVLEKTCVNELMKMLSNYTTGNYLFSTGDQVLLTCQKLNRPYKILNVHLKSQNHPKVASFNLNELTNLGCKKSSKTMKSSQAEIIPMVPSSLQLVAGCKAREDVGGYVCPPRSKIRVVFQKQHKCNGIYI